MRIFLGALVLVLALATACSGGGDDPEADPTSEPSARASEETAREKPPRRRLRAAQRALAKATSGAYDLAVGVRGVDAPFMTEKGRFDARHEVMEIERTVPRPEPEEGQSSSLVIRIRSSAKARFMQMDDWGPWEGCWIDMASGFTSLVGVDITALPNIPVPVSLVLDAQLAPHTQPALARPGGTPSLVPAASTPAKDTVTVHTDGVTALQMFGVSGSVLFDLDPAVEKAKVPVTLSYFERHPNVVKQVTIDGAAAAAALRATDTDLDRRVTRFLRAARTGAIFRPDVIPVEFLRPAPEKLLPDGATRDQTCPANLD